MSWIKGLLKAWAIARIIVKKGGVLMVESAQLKAAYLNAVDLSSEGGRKVTKSEWQRLAGKGFDILSLLFSWKK